MGAAAPPSWRAGAGRPASAGRGRGAGRRRPPRPASTTTTTSAASAVESRCAIATDVRPRVSPVQGALQAHLGGGVDGRGGLVEHEQVRVGEVGPGQRDQLALAGRQRLPALAHLRCRDRAAAARPTPAGRARSSASSDLVAPGGVARAAARGPRDGRSPRRCSLAGCRRRGSPPAARARRARAATRSARRAGPRRRRAPARRWGPSAGSAAWRAWSCPIRSRRRPRPAPAAAGRGRRRAARRGRPGRRTRRGRTGRRSARGAARRRRSPGSATSAGVSRTPSTRRQPGDAFCSSLSTSVPICTGPVNSWTRNRKASSSPRVSLPVDPEPRADDDDGGDGRGRRRARRC